MFAVFTFGINMSEIINNIVEKSEENREERLERKQQLKEEQLKARQEAIENRRKEKQLMKEKANQEVLEDENIGEQIKINFGGRILDENDSKKRKKYDHKDDDLTPLTKETKKVEAIQPDVIENNLFRQEEEKKEDKTKEVLQLEHAMIVEDENYSLVAKRPEDSVFLYKVKNSLSLGFMIPTNFDKLWEMSGNNPFEVQNSFAKSSTGIDDMFTQVDASSFGTTSTIDVTEDSDLYIYCTTYVEDISYTAENAITGFNLSGSATGLKHRQIVHIGEVPAGTTVNVTAASSDVSSLQLYAYAFHEDVMNQVLELLADESFDVTEYDDTYVKGNITAKEDGVMYTSIIYDKGWKAYVDGEEVEISSVKGALLTVPVSEGEHTIELKYTPEGFVSGWLITICSIVILVCCALYDHKKRKIKLENEE